MRPSIILLLTVTLLVACSSKSGPAGGSGTPVSSSGDFSMTLSFEPAPPKQGSETLTIALTDGSGNPAKGATVTIDTKMPDMQMTGPSIRLQDNGDGTYSGVQISRIRPNGSSPRERRVREKTGPRSLKRM